MDDLKMQEPVYCDKEHNIAAQVENASAMTHNNPLPIQINLHSTTHPSHQIPYKCNQAGLAYNLVHSRATISLPPTKHKVCNTRSNSIRLILLPLLSNIRRKWIYTVNLSPQAVV